MNYGAGVAGVADVASFDGLLLEKKPYEHIEQPNVYLIFAEGK